jgi:hypothetical protein
MPGVKSGRDAILSIYGGRRSNNFTVRERDSESCSRERKDANLSSQKVFGAAGKG